MNTSSIPPGLPGAQLQMVPSGSSGNLYTMTSPTEINSNVNPYGVPHVAGGAASAPRYSYAR